MRQKLAAILIVVVFFSLQYGKIATYLYCEWQAAIVQNNPDCGCDDHLTSLFEHDDDSSKNDLAKNTLNEKLTEFPPRSIMNIPQIVSSASTCFTEYNVELSESFIDCPFQPPIA